MRISDWSSDCALPISVELNGQHRHEESAHRNAIDQLRHGQIPEAGISGVARPHEIRDGECRKRYCCEQPGIQLSAETGNKRSEEHTSELQSLMRISYAVFCLKKKTNIQILLHKT